jgi:hypothetical protein
MRVHARRIHRVRALSLHPALPERKKTPPEGGVQITASITGACCRPAPMLVAYY